MHEKELAWAIAALELLHGLIEKASPSRQVIMRYLIQELLTMLKAEGMKHD